MLRIYIYGTKYDEHGMSSDVCIIQFVYWKYEKCAGERIGKVSIKMENNLINVHEFISPVWADDGGDDGKYAISNPHIDAKP